MAASSSRGDYGFALVIGLVDGILTALILAAGKVAGAGESIYLSDLLRVAVVASVSAAFTFFVAQYSRFRHELVHAERHLTLGSRGPLVKTQLGRAVLLESVAGSFVSGGCSSAASFCDDSPRRDLGLAWSADRRAGSARWIFGSLRLWQRASVGNRPDERRSRSYLHRH